MTDINSSPSSSDKDATVSSPTTTTTTETANITSNNNANETVAISSNESNNNNNTSNSNQINKSSNSIVANNEVSIENTKMRLLFEYEKLKDLNLRGLYVIPSFNSIFEWHSVLFIRNRVYRSSVIRFLIVIPDDYPNSCPSVKFQTPVFHPLVGMDGEFELQHHFPDWKAEKYMIPNILCYIKNIFHNPEKYNNYPPLNPEASKLLIEDYEEFLRKVSHFVKLSIQNVYENPQFSPIVFSSEIKDKQQFENAKNTVLKKDTSIVGKFKNIFGSR